MGQATIETRGGGRYTLGVPEFNLEDIASSLSKRCRFGGHTKDHLFYSVAEHSVLVSNLMGYYGGDPREGLHHDDVEAYIGDLVAPFKKDKRFEFWKPEIEDPIDRQIREWLGLPPTKTQECEDADKCALLIESRELMVSGGDWYQKDYGPRVTWMFEDITKKWGDIIVYCLPPAKAYDLWMKELESV